ncbi:hypothetical protein GCM10023257_11780 [Streptomyces hyderabadensis]|uniref:Uncharacterized protein n=1 Tax=Streptomyces hyderabadensis TaxID=598549 RepID=A0ABP9HQU1_9ACTN
MPVPARGDDDGGAGRLVVHQLRLHDVGGRRDDGESAGRPAAHARTPTCCMADSAISHGQRVPQPWHAGSGPSAGGCSLRIFPVTSQKTACPAVDGSRLAPGSAVRARW